MEGLHNPYIECPYNRAHQVPTLRMQYHLVKCRRNNPELAKNMKSCPFNATHIMPETELQYHFRSCTERNLIEGQRYMLNPAQGELGNPSFHPSVPVEKWDDDDYDDDDNEQELNVRQDNPPERATTTNDDEYVPGGALGISVKSTVPMLRGVGRGQLNHLMAKLNKEVP